MKLKAPDAVAARARSPIISFLGICLAAFLTTFSASAAPPGTGVEGLNPAEEWVVAQVTAGKIADLSMKFPTESDRQLSAHFLEDLLTGARPDVTLHRHGVQIIGACIDEPIDLENAQIPCEVSLVSCRFSSRVTFVNASFARTAVFTGSVFKTDADFYGMKIGYDAVFSKTVFEGPVRFHGANVAGVFFATQAQFRNKEKMADFEGMKVGSDAFFSNTVFEGTADFVVANILRSFYADEAQFNNKEKIATFEAMKVGFAAFFSKTVFEGPASFSGADIVTELDMTGAKFQNKQKTANFKSMKVGGYAFFNDAVFEGPVALGDAEFGWLDLSSVFWPKVAAQFHMQGMSYKTILAAREEPESHKALLKLADQSAYSADVYSHLEEFFLRQGYRADADEAFIAGKVGERQEYFRSGDWLGWLRSWVLDLLVGYGRKPWRAGIPCAVLVALGCVLFSPKKMEAQNPEDTPRVYNRFWYSLGLFLPFVDLQSNKVWKPKADQTFLRNYMRVHILLGWILVPLVLAAVTGLIK
jgi:uncharacterized protein YjbI with pentapeptide repeats